VKEDTGVKFLIQPFGFLQETYIDEMQSTK